MFGLEGQKKKKNVEEFVFDLEKDLKNPTKQKELQQLIERRIQTIKDMLRTGDAQEDFNQLGHLLNGYHSLFKVMTRVTAKKLK